jgi:hypothetical protein
MSLATPTFLYAIEHREHNAADRITPSHLQQYGTGAASKARKVPLVSPVSNTSPAVGVADATIDALELSS